MKFLAIQIIIVVLICIFFAALSNLAELGFLGWILAASTGHGLYRIYKHLHRSMKASNTKNKCVSCNTETNDLSYQIQSFMFDDATNVGDE